MTRCAYPGCNVYQGDKDCGKTEKGQPAMNFFRHNGQDYCSNHLKIAVEENR